MSKDEVWVFSEYCKEHRTDNICSSDLCSLGKKACTLPHFSVNQQISM